MTFGKVRRGKAMSDELTIEITEAHLVLIWVILRQNGKPNATIDDAGKAMMKAVKEMQSDWKYSE